ncbi:MAG: Nucleotidyl transferase [Ferruginibacter sp.]|nr:Nucleotidyl transferase [Ferruginibacter sp.]
MIKEAIILAGGLGTRLRSAVADLPKCMAPVQGIPFIHFIVTYLQKQGIEKFIFSLGYKHERITQYIDKTFDGLNRKYIIETEQLGTGGAIKKAALATESENVIVVNGDTLFNIDIANLAEFHEQSGADCTLALKEMSQFRRYGSVELFSSGVIKAFHEKKFCEKGLINGGIYALHIPSFLKEPLPDVFSFEKDFIEKYTAVKKICGAVYQNYFIDIGIPEDYQRFQDDYNNIILKNPSVESLGNETTSSFLNSFFDLLD